MPNPLAQRRSAFERSSGGADRHGRGAELMNAGFASGRRRAHIALHDTYARGRRRLKPARRAMVAFRAYRLDATREPFFLHRRPNGWVAAQKGVDIEYQFVIAYWWLEARIRPCAS